MEHARDPHETFDAKLPTLKELSGIEVIFHGYGEVEDMFRLQCSTSTSIPTSASLLHLLTLLCFSESLSQVIPPRSRGVQKVLASPLSPVHSASLLLINLLASWFLFLHSLFFLLLLLYPIHHASPMVGPLLGRRLRNAYQISPTPPSFCSFARRP
jgi:hypothetical protein